MDVRIEKCNSGDLDEIIEIGIKTYYDTFHTNCSKEVMDSYLKEAFTKKKISSEVNNKNSHFYFAYVDNKLAGYIKINTDDAQCDLKDQNGLEIERIYVKKEFKGKGVGQKLMNLGIEKAKEFNKDFVWLGVWEINQAAIEFYKKNGFTKAGEHSFRMGDEIQNDYIMKKAL